MGDKYPIVQMNSIVKNPKDLEAVPLRRTKNGAVYVRDIATIEDGADVTTSYALANGLRTVYLPVTTRADASTLAVVSLVKKNLPEFQKILPDDIKVSYVFDQSPAVKRSIEDVLKEGGLGALLTGLMVLLFLRDWRSALIVVINIPLALFAAVFALWVTGQTIHLMTLGGLALAVGILVDEATVAVENIHVHLGRSATPAQSAYEGTRETATTQRFPPCWYSRAAWKKVSANTSSKKLARSMSSAATLVRCGVRRTTRCDRWQARGSPTGPTPEGVGIGCPVASIGAR